MSFDDITKDTIKGHAIRELQGLRKAVVAGDTATTDIAVTGLTVKGSTLVSVLQEDGVSGITEAERVSEAAVTSDGNLQLSTTDTTGKTLIVEWFQKPDA